MKPDLGRAIERRNSGSLKWDSRPTGAVREDLIPLWVADMDFPAPESVKMALQNRVDHGVFGYAQNWAGFEQALATWMEKRHGWHIHLEHIVPVPGVMTAVSLLVEELTNPGDGVIIQPPVYPPFKRTPGQLDRRIVENPLVWKDGRFQMDLDGLAKACRSGASLALLCSPHNPVGRVWTAEELSKAMSICADEDVAVVADEIHCDILPWMNSFTPSQSVSAEGQIVVSLVAPTKTFNLAGMSIGAAIIKDEKLRARYKDRLYTLSLNLPNILSTRAATAAYNEGEGWLDEVLSYVKQNAEYVRTRLAEEIPAIGFNQSEGTYLVWLDFSNMGFDDETIKSKLLNEAGVWLNHGPYFGTGGTGFQRMNIACPRSILEQALDNLASVFGENKAS